MAGQWLIFDKCDKRVLMNVVVLKEVRAIFDATKIQNMYIIIYK